MSQQNPNKQLSQINPSQKKEYPQAYDLASDDEDNQNNKNFEEEDSEEEIPDEMLNERIDTIMKRLEQLDVDKEIGEKDKKKDTRIIIDKIILENFKSYAGKKIIGPLHFRFNSVVGPNGSGKSNLMESLLFVFGKRAKKMRLKKLNELIHNSSLENKYKYTKVSIYFREIKEIGDDFSYVENGDFVISRIVYSNSSSQYTLNGHESSFDEVNNVLNKKGIDLKHNRFLILQGEVEQISMMKPKAQNENETGLLEFLEDIIGTRRYVPLIDKLSKSIEDLGEIKTSKANRVKISRNEIDQLEDVKNQSLNYYHKEKESKILRHLLLNAKKGIENNKILLKREEMNKIQDEIKEIQKEMAEQISQSKNVLLAHKNIQTQIDNLSTENKNLNSELNKIEENDKIKQNEIENQGKLIQKTQKEITRLQNQYKSQNEEISKAQDEKPNLQKDFETKNKKFTELDLYLSEKEKEIYAKTEKFQSQKKEIENQLRPSETQISQNNFKIQQNEETLKLLKEKSDKQKEITQKLLSKKDELTKLLEEKKKNYNEFLLKKQQLEKQKNEKEQLVKEKEQKTFQKNKDLQEKLAKLSEYRNSNQELKNKNTITTSLLTAQNEGKIQGFFGRLGDLGTIDKKYDIAISTACPQLDFLVVDTPSNARNILTFLRNNNIGTASIIILEKVSWVERYFTQNYNCPQGTQRLYDLVNFTDKRLQNAFYFALRDTLVTNSIEIATKVGYGQNRHRVVTLDGVIVEITGAMQGGGKPRGGKMSNTVINYNKDHSDQEIKNMENLYNKEVQEYNNLKNEYNNLEQSLQRIKRDLSELDNVGIKLDDDLMKIKQGLKEVNDTIKVQQEMSNKNNPDEVQINKIKNENNKLKNENNNLNDQTKELRNALNDINLKLTEAYGEEYNKKKTKKRKITKKK